uniref:Uncharacterized protein n=1 Tax=Elaeophora elaphi TaxID=1147741 RepID=A0A0R3S0X6_9BILA
MTKIVACATLQSIMSSCVVINLIAVGEAKLDLAYLISFNSKMYRWNNPFVLSQRKVSRRIFKTVKNFYYHQQKPPIFCSIHRYICCDRTLEEMMNNVVKGSDNLMDAANTIYDNARTLRGKFETVVAFEDFAYNENNPKRMETRDRDQNKIKWELRSILQNVHEIILTGWDSMHSEQPRHTSIHVKATISDCCITFLVHTNRSTHLITASNCPYV